MDESPRSRMTLRQALSRLWQVPLLLTALTGLALLLWALRPQHPEPSFEEQFKDLQLLSDRNLYPDFYPAANALREKAGDLQQLAQIHLLSAQTRVRQLQQKHELDWDAARRSALANYEAIVKDYGFALGQKLPEENTPAAGLVYFDLARVYWCLKDAEKAILCMKKAQALGETYQPEWHRGLVTMYLEARPKDYQQEAHKEIETILANEESTPEDRAWAFVRKQEILIAEGQEAEVLRQLESMDSALKQSQYGDALEYLRGRALRHAGKTDEAEQILRELIKKTSDRGDIYAQAALELGRINYEQNRDFEARQYYDLVVSTQSGKDWFVAGKLGQAECLALQQRYEESAAFYHETVELLEKNPFNREVDITQVQRSLIVLAQQLSLTRQYRLALSFLEIEQAIAPKNDVLAAERFARMHEYLAQQLLKERDEAIAAVKDQEAGGNEKEWLTQQEQLITHHFQQAARNYERVVDQVKGNESLYSDCLWEAAVCYDKAGLTREAIAAWGRVYTENQEKPNWAQAVFNLAQAHQSIGQYQQAITYYEQLRAKHPMAPAALDGIVPLAQCYLAREEPDYNKAEALLKGVFDNRALTPVAPYYRQAKFRIGELYYQRQQYGPAVNHLTEAIDRYPDDRNLGKSMFLVADSYRRSGHGLDSALAQLAQDPTAALSQERTTETRRQHLAQAREYFNRSIDFFEKQPEGRLTALDQLYLRQSYLYRGDCLYDLGLYREAFDSYERTVLRYQRTPSALAALVQMANCQLRMGNYPEARAANEQARWQLRQMPDQVIASGSGNFSRVEWETWFNSLDQAGLWN